MDKLKPSVIHYKSIKGSIADRELIDKLFAEYHFDIVVNLVAQAGVRYSIENPDVYIESNIIGLYNILEACRHSVPVQGSKFKVHGSWLSGSTTPCVCFFKLGVWRQQEGAV